MNPYKELIEFVVANVPAEAIANFRASDELHDHVYSLIDKEKAGIATEEERKELDKFMDVERMIRSMKIKAKQSVYAPH